MKAALAITSFLACALTSGTASAQSGDKVDAKSLMQSGLKLFAAKDYLGALAVFKTAYERFPSSKILLNIGTTLLKLDRKAEAANAYQRYLDSADATDPAKRAEATRVLGELDREVARLDIAVTPEDGEVQINEGEWSELALVKTHRVGKGLITVRARKQGWKPGEETFKVGPGETRSVALTLEAEPVVTPDAGDDGEDDGGVRKQATPAQRSRIGAVVAGHFDPINPGGAARVGLVGDVISRVQVQAAALLGPVFGAYAGGSFAILPGKLQPFVAAGATMFFNDGARFGLRGAAGAEYGLHRQVTVFVEVGGEYTLSSDPMLAKRAQFIPAVGVTGRL